jgi:tRNA(adenine34) deaminase
MDRPEAEALDLRMMTRCLEVAAEGGRNGEFPFAAVICRDGQIVTEATNQVARDRDVTRHAELVAVSQAQRKLGHPRLDKCTLYSIVEPCPMCSFPIRETRIAKVVFAIRSPVMGGFSRWNILRDAKISDAMPEAFGDVPEVVTDLLLREAEQVWHQWNPLIWGIIRHRGCFIGTGVGSGEVNHYEAEHKHGFLWNLFAPHG